MNVNLKNLIAVFLLGALVAACIATPKEIPKVSYFKNKHLFALGPEGGVNRILIGEGMEDFQDLRVALSQYHQIIIDSIVVSYQQKESYDNISNRDLASLSEQFRITLADALRKRYRIVTNPQLPNTLRLSLALTGVEGVSLSKGKTRMDSASIEGFLRDSSTNEILVAVIDSRKSNKDLSLPEGDHRKAENAFEWWAQRLRLTLDDSRI
jgi:hypothetical protein